MRLLVVCLGNICRSPLAEGLLRHYLDDDKYIIDSAGTSSFHVGFKPHQYSIKVAKERGIDISQLRARNFVFEDFEKFDVIYAMDQNNYQTLFNRSNLKYHQDKIKVFLSENKNIQNLDVPDPYNGTYNDFEYVFNLLDETSQLLSKKLQL